MIRLLTVGDSFTCGDELTDITQAYPYVLADRLGWSVTNLGYSGASNTGILRTAVENVVNFDVVIAGWSHFDRIELADQQGIFESWPGRQKKNLLDRSASRAEFDRYYTLNYNDDYLYRQYLINILLFQSVMEANGCRFLMLDAFGNHLDARRHASNNQDLIGRIKTKNFVGWPDKSMQEFAQGCPQGPIGHFLEQGHKQVADKLYEHIRNLSWIS